jgi:cytidylate kinase
MDEIKPEKIIIAIDGHSACGKSTLAKEISKLLGYIYVDSGAMYRAVTLYFLEHKIDLNNIDDINSALKKIHIHFELKDSMNRTFLNGVDVEDEIRGMNVSRQVSQVAAISEVRKAMVAIQKKMGQQKGIVMDGRDIGSVVFPEAELKIFLTADTDERVQRRLLEMLSKNMPADFNDIKANLISRDQIDSTRADSPLIKAADAVIIDNTHLSKTEQLAMAMKLVAERTRVGS